MWLIFFTTNNFFNVSNISLKVYSWGSNEYCRLGREVDAYSKLNIPGKLDSLSKECIIDIASNYYISLALTDTGKVNNDYSIEIITIVFIC